MNSFISPSLFLTESLLTVEKVAAQSIRQQSQTEQMTMTATNTTPTEDQKYYNVHGGEYEQPSAAKHFDKLKDQFAALPMAIFEDVRTGQLNPRDVCLYAHLLAKQGINRTLFWGVDNLAELTGTSETTVKSSIRRLEATDHIARIPGPATTHTVCLTRLDPRKGSNRILIKDKSLVPLPRKKGAGSNGLPSAFKQSAKIYRSASKRISSYSANRIGEQEEQLASGRDADEYRPY